MNFCFPLSTALVGTICVRADMWIREYYNVSGANVVFIEKVTQAIQKLPQKIMQKKVSIETEYE